MDNTITKEAPATDKTIEIEEPAAETPAVAPSADELKKEGWTADEIAAARKRGILPKDEAAEKSTDKPAEKTAAPPAKAAAAAGDPAAEPEGEAKPAGGIPDMQLTPEKEAEFLKAFGPGTPQNGLYFRMKNERRARQKVEAELAALKAQLTAKAAPAADPAAEDDEDAPVTKKMLQDWERQKEEERTRQLEEQQQRVQIVTAAQAEQEEYAKSVYPDWKDTAVLAVDLLKDLKNDGNMVPEKHRKAKLIQLVKELQLAAAQADAQGLDDRHAAFIAYEIGQLHPQYGKPKAPAGGEPRQDGPSKEIPKAPGAIKPETLKRIENNTQRRGSSAAVPAGSGKRTIDADEVTPEDFAGWDYKRRASFKAKFPEQYASLMRG